MVSDFDQNEEFIRSSLLCDADIPPASDGFAHRCLAAVGPAASSRKIALWRTRAFCVAASVAAVAGVAVLVASIRTAKTEGRGGEARSAAAVEDVSVVGVKASNPSASGATAMSNESVVNADPGATALWKTLNAGQTQMAWEWPECAKSARLTITGGGITAEKVYGKGDAFPVWNPAVPESFDEDEVFTAKLTFYNGERGAGDEIESLVADGIGFVRGISGGRLAMDGLTVFRIAKK